MLPGHSWLKRTRTRSLLLALTQPWNGPRSPHPGLTPLWGAHQPGSPSPVSRAWYLPQDQLQALPNSLPGSCVPQ